MEALTFDPVVFVFSFIAGIVIFKMLKGLFPPKEIIAGHVFALETRQRKVFCSSSSFSDSDVVIDVPERLLKIKDWEGKILTISDIPKDLFDEIKFHQEKSIICRKDKRSKEYEFCSFIEA